MTTTTLGQLFDVGPDLRWGIGPAISGSQRVTGGVMQAAVAEEVAGDPPASGLLPAGQDRRGHAERDTEAGDRPGSGAGDWLGGLDVETAVPIPTGWTTIGDLAAGDLVFGPDGHLTRVVAVGEVTHSGSCVQLCFSDGQRLVADAEHLWVTELTLQRRRESQLRAHPLKHRRVGTDEELAAVASALTSPGPVVVSPFAVATELGWSGSAQLKRIYTWAKDLTPTGTHRGGAPLYDRRALLEHLHYRLQVTWGAHQRPDPHGPVTTAHIADTVIHYGTVNHSILVADPVDLPEADLTLHPYLLGCWLGDGTSTSSELTTADPELVERLASLGYTITKRTAKYLYGVSLPGSARTAGSVRALLRALGVLGDKHVPIAYLRAGTDQRRELLAGLLDTDGTVSPAGGQVQFTSTNHRLAAAAHELACTLGYRPTIREGRARLNGRDCGPSWQVGFTTTDDVFRLPRKQQALQERCRSDGTRTRARYITDAVPVPTRPVRAIRTARPDQLLLAGRSFITTTGTRLTMPLADTRGGFTEGV